VQKYNFFATEGYCGRIFFEAERPLLSRSLCRQSLSQAGVCDGRNAGVWRRILYLQPGDANLQPKDTYLQAGDTHL